TTASPLSCASRTRCRRPAATRSARRRARPRSGGSRRTPGSPASAGPPRRRSISCTRCGRNAGRGHRSARSADAARRGVAMRPRQPDRSGVITRDGVRVAWEVHGDQNSPSVLLLPTWSIADAGHCKFQIPVLARRYRVVVVEGRGNGRTDRPLAPAAYAISEYLADTIAVLDATGTSEAVVAGVSMGGARALALAAQEPGRVLGAVLIGPSVGSLADPSADGTDADDAEESEV